VYSEHLDQLKGIYDGSDNIGPFSYKGNLDYMLRPGSWLDCVVLDVISQLLQMKMTLVLMSPVEENRFRHGGDLKDVDAVVLHNGKYHFSGAGE